MFITPCGNDAFHHVPAHHLPTEQLVGQWADMLVWLREEEDSIVNSKFSMEMAWFREVWYELSQRNMLRVH